jgi:hypothetical protein
MGTVRSVETNGRALENMGGIEMVACGDEYA